MNVYRTIICNVCQEEKREIIPGDGFPGWGNVGGLDKPYSLCQTHMLKLIVFLNQMEKEGQDHDSNSE